MKRIGRADQETKTFSACQISARNSAIALRSSRLRAGAVLAAA